MVKHYYDGLKCKCCGKPRDVHGLSMCFECHKVGCWIKSDGTKIIKCAVNAAAKE